MYLENAEVVTAELLDRRVLKKVFPAMRNPLFPAGAVLP
jgi:hypothetical protein